MTEKFDEELPDSIRRGQRLTTMTSGQSRFPIAPSLWNNKFRQPGKHSQAWINTELLPHTSTVLDDLAVAQQRKDVAFRTLHRECGTPIKQKRWCPHHERDVEADELVKGWEFVKGEYVMVDDSDLEAVALQRSLSIEILRFVKLEDVDPVYFDRTYYLEPDSKSPKAYVLLRRTLEETDRTAVVKFALRQRTRLAALRVRDEVLVAPDWRAEHGHSVSERGEDCSMSAMVDHERRARQDPGVRDVPDHADVVGRRERLRVDCRARGHHGAEAQCREAVDDRLQGARLSHVGRARGDDHEGQIARCRRWV
jgi:hypothetical protein